MGQLQLGVQCRGLAEARATPGCTAVDTLCGGWIEHPLLCLRGAWLPFGADQLLGACVIRVRLFFATPLRHLFRQYTVYLCIFVRLCAANVSRCQRNSFTIMMVPLQATSFLPRHLSRPAQHTQPIPNGARTPLGSAAAAARMPRHHHRRRCQAARLHRSDRRCCCGAMARPPAVQQHAG